VTSRGPPCATLLHMLMRATTATLLRCVQRGLGWEKPGARRESSSVTTEDDPTPNIVQLNTEGLTANRISFVE